LCAALAGPHFAHARGNRRPAAKALRRAWYTVRVVEIGELLAGKYRVERVLGKGGMGYVVLALHTQLEQRVAVKLLMPELAVLEEPVARFLREARAAVKIRSEHVARVIDVGKLDDGTPYMVMEYLEGHDLAAELDVRGAPTPRRIRGLRGAGQ